MLELSASHVSLFFYAKIVFNFELYHNCNNFGVSSCLDIMIVLEYNYDKYAHG